MDWFRKWQQLRDQHGIPPRWGKSTLCKLFFIITHIFTENKHRKKFASLANINGPFLHWYFLIGLHLIETIFRFGYLILGTLPFHTWVVRYPNSYFTSKLMACYFLPWLYKYNTIKSGNLALFWTCQAGITSVGDRIRRIRVFLGLLNPDPLVRGTDPDTSHKCVQRTEIMPAK